jgi:radical SAM protein with 4Fe4S-binding SPASM domain
MKAEGPPEIVEIEPIHTCNLRCVQCYVSYSTMTKQRLDPAFVDRLSGLEGKWAKIGSQCEPVAHPKFAQIVNAISDKGMRIDLVSNGTLFTDKLIRAVERCNFENVTISFDGATAPTYERIRRRARFDQTIERILAFKNAVKARNPTAQFTVNYTYMHSNVAEAADAIDLWEQHGFDHVGFISMTIPFGAEKALAEESPGRDLDRARASMLEVAQRIVHKGHRITASSGWFRDPLIRQAMPEHAAELAGGVISSSHPGKRYAYNPIPDHQNGTHPHVPVPCRSPYKLARIEPDGRVVLCQKFAIGSIYDADLLALWDSPRARKLRISIKRDAHICHTCDYFRFCLNADRIDYESPTVHSKQRYEPLGYDPTIGPPPALLQRPGIRWLDQWFKRNFSRVRDRLKRLYFRLYWQQNGIRDGS